MNRVLFCILSVSLVLMVSLSSCSKDDGSENRVAGEKFLEENGKRPEVTVTASGLQYEVLVMGEGDVPNSSSRVRVRYKGTLINETEFDSGVITCYTQGNIIAGWKEVLIMMPIGSKWKVYIPYNLGYGSESNADIPAYSVLIFEMELLGLA